jgi:hypothetical protein
LKLVVLLEAARISRALASPSRISVQLWCHQSFRYFVEKILVSYSVCSFAELSSQLYIEYLASDLLSTEKWEQTKMWRWWWWWWQWSWWVAIIKNKQ